MKKKRFIDVLDVERGRGKEGAKARNPSPKFETLHQPQPGIVPATGH